MRRAFAYAAAVALVLPATATAGTYTFAIPKASIKLVGPEAGGSPAFRLIAPSSMATQASASPGHVAGAWGRAWLTLPGGATFQQVGGQVSLGGLQVNPTGLWGSIVVKSGDGTSVVAWVRQMTAGLPSFAWSYNGATTRPVAVGAQISATATGACGTCGVTLDTLTGTISDTQPPSTVTASSAAAGGTTTTRFVQVAWSVTDAAAGPGNVAVAINGQRQATLLRTAPAANAALLTGQRAAGNATVGGSGTVTLPDFDGSYAIQVVGADAVGNEAGSNGMNVVLDRGAPQVDATVPDTWCATSCVATLKLADFVSGLATVTASVGGVDVPVDPIPPSTFEATRTLDLNAAGVQGATVAHVVVTDRAGNAKTLDLPIRLDHAAPAVEAASADPATRQVNLDVGDASGLRAASVTVAGHAVELGTIGPPRLGLQTYEATLPETGFPSALDGLPAKIALTDLAGNLTQQTVTFRSRTPAVVHLRSTTRRVTFGKRITVAGTLAGPGLPETTTVVLALENPNWPAFTRTWRATVRSGRFSIRLRPTMSGVLRVRFGGTTDLRSFTKNVGRVAIKPRITARFTYRRLPSGLLGSIRVAGRFAPAGGPRVTLAWQAQSPRTGEWFSVCRGNDGAAVGPRGTFRARCHLDGLPAGVRLRLALLRVAGSPYAPATSRAVRLG